MNWKVRGIPPKTPTASGGYPHTPTAIIFLVKYYGAVYNNTVMVGKFCTRNKFYVPAPRQCLVILSAIVQYGKVWVEDRRSRYIRCYVNWGVYEIISRVDLDEDLGKRRYEVKG